MQISSVNNYSLQNVTAKQVESAQPEKITVKQHLQDESIEKVSNSLLMIVIYVSLGD